MKKSLRLLTVALGTTVLLASCSSITGSGPKMNSPEATALVVETLQKNIDFDQWKLYNVRWLEGEKLENELQILAVDMVNPSGDCFTQSFILSGPSRGNASDLRKALSMPKVDFDKVKGITPESIDPAAIQKQYDEALKSIPEGYTFKSIGSYEIGETMPSGNKFLDRNKILGEIKAEFDINITENGKEVIESAGKKSIQYYELRFNVQPDGSVELDE